MSFIESDRGVVLLEFNEYFLTPVILLAGNYEENGQFIKGLNYHDSRH